MSFLLTFRTTRFPVLFVFGKAPIDIPDCFQKFQESFASNESKVVVFYECRYQHAVKQFEEQLNALEGDKKYTNVHVTMMDTEFKRSDGSSQPPKKTSGCGACDCAEKEVTNETKAPSDPDCCTPSTEGSCVSPTPAIQEEKVEALPKQFDFCGRKLPVLLDLVEEGYSMFYIGEEEDEEVTLLLMAFHQVPVRGFLCGFVDPFSCTFIRLNPKRFTRVIEEQTENYKDDS